MIDIHSNIKESQTLPGEFYKSQEYFDQCKEKIFANSWQWVADLEWADEKNELYPFTLLPGVLDEPLLLTNDGKTIRCLSNVCTHRGKILVEMPKKAPLIGCGYHGRCFELDGTFKSMPEFKETANFPRPEDNLTKISVKEWLGMVFISLKPSFDFDKAIAPIMRKIDFLPLDALRFKESLSKNYDVKSNWALYVDNYLEGFHVPFVHPSLNKALDFKHYEYETYDYCNLQVGIAKENEPCFVLPETHPDFGKRIYAYYFWLFPNMMLNFYPWGLSLNCIQPTDLGHTKVVFRTYQFKDTDFTFEANNIDLTEMEDEQVVESVQKGIQSRYYKSGRFSPTMERCVHHFHTLIQRTLA